MFFPGQYLQDCGCIFVYVLFVVRILNEFLHFVRILTPIFPELVLFFYRTSDVPMLITVLLDHCWIFLWMCLSSFRLGQFHFSFFTFAILVLAPKCLLLKLLYISFILLVFWYSFHCPFWFPSSETSKPFFQTVLFIFVWEQTFLLMYLLVCISSIVSIGASFVFDSFWY